MNECEIMFWKREFDCVVRNLFYIVNINILVKLMWVVYFFWIIFWVLFKIN